MRVDERGQSSPPTVIEGGCIMNNTFTVNELYNLIKISPTEPNCGIDELLMLLAEFIGDDRVIDEVNKYVDEYYESLKEELYDR